MLEEYDRGRLDLHLPCFLWSSQSVCYQIKNSDVNLWADPVYTRSQPTREKSSLLENRAAELTYQALTLEMVSGSRLAHTSEMSTASSHVLILAL